jgi:hypothetical protein
MSEAEVLREMQRLGMIKGQAEEAVRRAKERGSTFFLNNELLICVGPGVFRIRRGGA